MGMIWVGYRRDPDEARAILEGTDPSGGVLEQDDATSVDLDKAWHGIHWLLTDSAEPTDEVASDAIFGGEPVGGDVGYGPGRLLPATQVAAVAAALGQIDTEDLRSRLDGDAMEEEGIYPSIWDDEDVFDSYLGPNFEELRAFYINAAAAGQAVIQVIS